MDRVTQKEEKHYQIGRRDAWNNTFQANDSPHYLAGWQAGKLEKLEQSKETANDNRKL